MATSDPSVQPHAPVASRWVPEKTLPPYSYVTGKYPHPTRDRQGHAYGQEEEQLDPLDPNHWQDCQGYLWGIDLFNHGYYWEAHEAWEGVWHAHGRVGAVADFLKGLIKLAAAGVKARECRPAGVRRHAVRAQELLTQAASSLARPTSNQVAGLSMVELVNLCKLLQLHADEVTRDSDDPVVIVMPAPLRAQRR